ncbi:MAG: Ppx/GppA family phosphatase [Actinomycetota bacterium]|nr:Ppx/GppA family phosphatase [Actinomycetota bacterium]
MVGRGPVRRRTGVSRVAAIDCGTNSIRLLVADLTASGLVDVTRRMEIVRLGEGVDRTGEFAPAAIERTRSVLDSYAGAARALGAERIRMVATSASRDVANRGVFEEMVVRTLGQPPEVISGLAEARLSFAGATRGLTDVAAPYLVLDIGGGSTELVLGESTLDSAVSVDIGCVRITERHLHGDPPTAAEIAVATDDIRAGVTRAGQEVPLETAGTLIGLAGSVTTVAALALDLPAYDAQRIHHSRIGYDDVAATTAMLLRSTRRQRAALPVMHPGRVDVIAAGALVLRTVMEVAGAAWVLVSEHDILDGIAYSLA